MAWETQKAQMQASPLFISYNDEAGAYPNKLKVSATEFRFDCSRSGNLIIIDTQNLEAGAYIYQIITENKMIAQGTFIKY